MVLQEEKHMLGHPVVTPHLGDTVKVGICEASPAFLGGQGTVCGANTSSSGEVGKTWHLLRRQLNLYTQYNMT